MVKTNKKRIGQVIAFVICFFFSFLVNSKHHKDLTGLKLICHLNMKRYVFEFVDKQFFTERILNLETRSIEKRSNNYHYLTDKHYVYLERVDFVNQLFVRINRKTLKINDSEEMGCIILKVTVLEYLKKLKNELE
jgi:hypothetical protein